RAVGEPVRPADPEADPVAESAAGVDVVPARLRHHRAQLGQAPRPEQGVKAAGQPENQDDGRAVQMARDEPRRAQDAHADRAADDDREPEAETEQAAEMSGGGASVHGHRGPPIRLMTTTVVSSGNSSPPR